VPASGIASWDGTSWTAFSGTEFSYVRAVGVAGSELVVAAGFQDISLWNGDVWNQIGSATYVRVICSYDGSIYIGGRFQTAGGTEVSQNIARWSANPYPPGFAYFTARRETQSVVVEWRPAGALPLDGNFVVYRSSLEEDRLPVEGTLASTNGNFTFTDTNPPDIASDYWLWSDSPDGVARWFGPLSVTSTAPPAFRLVQSRPNPSRGPTTFVFETTKPSNVSLQIMDIQGRVIAVALPSTLLEQGARSVHWDGRDLTGRPVPSGVYFSVLQSDEGRRTKKLIVRR
jgi:hypothetical protein